LQAKNRVNEPTKRKTITPTFLINKEVYEWIRTKQKTIELRRGKPQNGDKIAFLSGRNESVNGKILRKHEGKLEEVLNAATYKKIIPTANSLAEAKDFIKQIYPQTHGTFTTYEFELDVE
jgi:ASC-1-like (ASCH) protein